MLSDTHLEETKIDRKKLDAYVNGLRKQASKLDAIWRADEWGQIVRLVLPIPLLYLRAMLPIFVKESAVATEAWQKLVSDFAYSYTSLTLEYEARRKAFGLHSAAIHIANRIEEKAAEESENLP